jgi:hypothetical protein
MQVERKVINNYNRIIALIRNTKFVGAIKIYNTNGRTCLFCVVFTFEITYTYVQINVNICAYDQNCLGTGKNDDNSSEKSELPLSRCNL